MKRIYSLLTFVMLLASIAAAQPKTTFVVKYVSAENVYLDGGSDDGLAVGDHLIITRKDGAKVELEVVYVALNSASCAIVGPTATVVVGDKADVSSKVASQPGSADTTKADTLKAAPRKDTTSTLAAEKRSYARPPQTRVNGTISYLMYNWNDKSPANLDFTQSTARFDFRARRLWGKEINFAFRSRGRYDQRQRVYNALVPKSTWENRLWEFSLSYDEPTAPVNFAVGRVLPRRVGGIGFLDGALVEGRLSDHLRIGAFGGSEPDWLYSSGQLSLMKGGGYISYRQGAYDKIYFEQSIAGVGQYHAANASREYVSLQGRLSVGNRWGMNNTADIDINRGWRKEKAGRAAELTNIYLGTYYRFSDNVRGSFSYDTRRNYWTLENQSVVDSLFDDRLRQGGHVQLDLSFKYRITTSVSYGYNKRAGDPKSTTSYSIYVNKFGLIGNSSSVSVQAAGFTGPFENGHNYSVRFGQNLSTHGSLGLGYGMYLYSVVSDNSHRTNNWVELTALADIIYHYYFNGLVQYNTGDDIKGVRLQAEIGYRF
jgi:hypothetical protein